MISGILITAKCHMHVPQSWDLYTELKTNMSNFLSGCLKPHGNKSEQTRSASDVLLLS